MENAQSATQNILAQANNTCATCHSHLLALMTHSDQGNLKHLDLQTHPNQLTLKIWYPAANSPLYTFFGLQKYQSLAGRAAACCPSCQRLWHWVWNSSHEPMGVLTIYVPHLPTPNSLRALLEHTAKRKQPQTSSSSPTKQPTTHHASSIGHNTSAQGRAMDARERRARERFSAKARALGAASQPPTPIKPQQRSRDLRSLAERHASQFFHEPYYSRWDTLPEYLPPEKVWSLDEIGQQHSMSSTTQVYLIARQSQHWHQARFEALHAASTFHHLKGIHDQELLVLETTWKQLVLHPKETFKAPHSVIMILPRQGKSYLIAQ